MKFFALISVFVATIYGHSESFSGYQFTQSVLNSYSVPLASVGPLPSTSSLGLNTSTFALSSQEGSGISSRELTEDYSSSVKDVSSSFITSNSSSEGYPDADVANRSFPSSETEDFTIDETEPGQNIIQKNIYVHLPAPELGQQFKQKAEVHLPPPRTHYKIIFIRSPTVPSADVAPVIPPVPQNEQRIIVYILSEKTEEGREEIVLSTPEPTEPARPEVYFINTKLKATNLMNPIKRRVMTKFL